MVKSDSCEGFAFFGQFFHFAPMGKLSQNGVNYHNPHSIVHHPSSYPPASPLNRPVLGSNRGFRGETQGIGRSYRCRNRRQYKVICDRGAMGDRLTHNQKPNPWARNICNITRISLSEYTGDTTHE